MKKSKNFARRFAACLAVALLLCSQAFAMEVPIEQTEQMIDGKQTLTKVFEVDPSVDPATLQEDGLEMNGFRYSLVSSQSRLSIRRSPRRFPLSSRRHSRPQTQQPLRQKLSLRCRTPTTTTRTVTSARWSAIPAQSLLLRLAGASRAAHRPKPKPMSSPTTMRALSQTPFR